MQHDTLERERVPKEEISSPKTKCKTKALKNRSKKDRLQQKQIHPQMWWQMEIFIS